MTRNVDIERVLEEWLAEGPRHMSDRLFNGTLDRIDRLPRGRRAGLRSGLPAMVRLATAAAVLIAVVGAGAVVVNRAPGVGGQPSPTSATARPVTVAALQALWQAVGDRQSPGDWGVGDDTFNIDSTGLRIEQVHGDVLSTLALTDGGTRLVLAFQHGITRAAPSNQQWLCRIGDEGIYRVRLSENGETLTLGLVSDPCVVRAAFVPGDWTRSVCQQGSYACGYKPPPDAGPVALDPKLAADIEATWTSVGSRVVPIAVGAVQIGIAFEHASLSMNGFKGWVASDWSVLPDGKLALRLAEPQASLTGQYWSCQTGDLGSYTVGLSDDRDTLLVTLVDDACLIRSSILVGAWSRCPDPATCPGWAVHEEQLEPSPTTQNPSP